MKSTKYAIARAALLAPLVATARRFASNRSGATAVEYAVMTFIAIAIVAAITTLGGSVAAMYEQLKGLFGN